MSIAKRIEKFLGKHSLTSPKRQVHKDMKFVIYQDRKGEYRWRLVGKNGRVIAVSDESYKRHAGVVKSLDLLYDATFASTPLVDETRDVKATMGIIEGVK